MPWDPHSPRNVVPGRRGLGGRPAATVPITVAARQLVAAPVPGLLRPQLVVAAASGCPQRALPVPGGGSSVGRRLECGVGAGPGPSPAPPMASRLQAGCNLGLKIIEGEGGELLACPERGQVQVSGCGWGSQPRRATPAVLSTVLQEQRGNAAGFHIVFVSPSPRPLGLPFISASLSFLGCPRSGRYHRASRGCGWGSSWGAEPSPCL